TPSTDFYTLSLHDALPIWLLAHGFGGSAPGTGPTFASEPLFFADLAGSTQQILPDGTRLPADNTLHSCQNADRTGSSDLCATDRSEEHTSELQSLAYLVCR